MVTRVSQALNVNPTAYPDVAQVGSGMVAPKDSPVIGDGGDEARQRLVLGILETGGKLAQQGYQKTTEEAYLSGQAAAATGQALDAIESSPTTATWATAGYRDTATRLKLADAQAKLIQDMPRLRQQSPEHMNEYLAESRAELMPMFDGMSLESRTAALGQMVLNDKAAVAKHATEYVAFHREQAHKAAQAEQAPLLANLNTAKLQQGAAGVLAVQESTRAYVGFLAGIRARPNLTEEDKDVMIGSAIEAALAGDNTAVMAYVRGSMAETATSPEHLGLMGTLSAKTQESVAKAEYAARNRTTDQRNEQFRQNVSAVKMAMELGQYAGTFEDVRSLGQEGIRIAGWSAEQATALEMEFIKAKGKAAEPSIDTLHTGFISGDSKAFGGIPEATVVDKLLKEWGEKKYPIEQQMVWLSQAGGNGHLTALSKLGDIGNRAMSAMNNPEDKPIERKKEFETFNAIVDSLRGGTDGIEGQKVLEGMDSSSQQRFLAIRALVKSGRDPAQALSERIEAETKLGNMSPSVRTAFAAAREGEDRKYVATRMAEGVDLLDRGIAALPWTDETTARNSVIPNDPLLGGLPRDVYIKQLGDARAAVLAEMGILRRADPDMPVQDAFAAGAANAAKRTLRVGDGVVTLPQGTTPQRLLDLNYTNEELGKALEKTFPITQPGNTMVFATQGNRITYQELDNQGIGTSRKGIVDKVTVLPALIAPKKARFDKAYAEEGPGKEYTDPTSGLSITLTGKRGRAPVSASTAYETKANLVRFEGIRDKVYTAGRGDNKRSVTGIGFAFKGYQPTPGKDGKITRAQIEASFEKATEDALDSGDKTRRLSTISSDEKATILFAEMTYQAGPLLSANNKKFYEPMIRAKTATEAVKAFRASPIYTDSNSERVQHYERLINKFWKVR